jgi:hypothetical protein
MLNEVQEKIICLCAVLRVTMNAFATAGFYFQ